MVCVFSFECLAMLKRSEWGWTRRQRHMIFRRFTKKARTGIHFLLYDFGKTFGFTKQRDSCFFFL